MRGTRDRALTFPEVYSVYDGVQLDIGWPYWETAHTLAVVQSLPVVVLVDQVVYGG